MNKNTANAAVVGAGAGGTLAIMAISILQAFGIDLPAQAVGGITTGLALIFGYVIRFLPRPPADTAGVILALVILLPALGACTPTQIAAADAATGAAIDTARAAADVEARALAAAPCKMTIGAWARIEDAAQRDAIAVLCGHRRPASSFSDLKEAIGVLTALQAARSAPAEP